MSADEKTLRDALQKEARWLADQKASCERMFSAGRAEGYAAGFAECREAAAKVVRERCECVREAGSFSVEEAIRALVPKETK